MKKATNKLFELKFHLQKDIYLLPTLGYYPQHSQKVFRCSVNPRVITQPIRYILFLQKQNAKIIEWLINNDHIITLLIEIIHCSLLFEKSINHSKFQEKPEILNFKQPPSAAVRNSRNVRISHHRFLWDFLYGLLIWLRNNLICSVMLTDIEKQMVGFYMRL